VTTWTFILKNALRNPRRSLLTVSSVAVSAALLTSMMTLQRELTVPPESEGASLRIIARNKVSLVQPLPARQMAEIERIPGIVAVTPFTYFGGQYNDEEFTSFAQFAVDPARFRSLLVEGRITEGDYDAWVKDRTGCMVGRDTMKRYGLKVGDRMKFRGTFYPCDLDLRIAAVFEGTVDDRGVFFHHKLLDELTGDLGTVGTWYLRVESAEKVPGVIAAIDGRFANTAAEVRAESERAFQMGFVGMLGNVAALIRTVNGVIVFTLALVGHQWWWEYRIADEDGGPPVVTANELVVPVGRPVWLRLASADVIHSWWVPALNGKTDLVPGRFSNTWFEAEKPGTFLGQCAEYCGTQHANMLLRVRAVDDAQFESWRTAQAAPARDPASFAAGHSIFLRLACMNCHAIDGSSSGAFGPNLTHLMSRETIAAGMAPLNRDTLRAWLVDPQQLKPGCNMPSLQLTDPELDALVDYLSSLN